MKKCSEIREMLSFYLDNELHENERKQVVKHLETCSECKAELELIKNLIDYTNDIEEVEMPDNYGEQLHMKLVEASKEQQPVKPAKNTNFYRWGSLVAGITVLFIGLSSGHFGLFEQKSETEFAYVKDAKLNTVDQTAMKQIENNNAAIRNNSLENTKVADQSLIPEETSIPAVNAKAKRIQVPNSDEGLAKKNQQVTPAYEVADNLSEPISLTDQPDVMLMADQSTIADDSNAKMFSMTALPESDTNNQPKVEEYMTLVIDTSKNSFDNVFSTVEKNSGKIEESQILRSYIPNNTLVERNFVIEVSKENYDKVINELKEIGTLNTKENKTDSAEGNATENVQTGNVVINLMVKSASN